MDLKDYTCYKKRPTNFAGRSHFSFICLWTTEICPSELLVVGVVDVNIHPI
jgi:hypothetical protein